MKYMECIDRATHRALQKKKQTDVPWLARWRKGMDVVLVED